MEFIFDQISFIFTDNKQMYKNLKEFKSRQIPPLTSDLSALERLEKSTYYIVATKAPSLLIGSFSFLQVTRTTIKSSMRAKFGQIRLWTTELAALERLEKSP